MVAWAYGGQGGRDCQTAKGQIRVLVRWQTFELHCDNGWITVYIYHIHPSELLKWVKFIACKICLNKSSLNKDIDEGKSEGHQQWPGVIWRPPVQVEELQLLKSFSDQVERGPWLLLSTPLSNRPSRNNASHFWPSMHQKNSLKLKTHPDLQGKKDRNTEFKGAVLWPSIL